MIHSIYAEHDGYSYPAELDDRRMLRDGRGEGDCVRALDPMSEWTSASTAAERITGTQVNGWLFWKLRGTHMSIDVLRSR